MTVPDAIIKLVKQYDFNRHAYQSGKYNETQLRHEFLDPFFMALGWDLNNEKGYAEAYKDVIHEDSIKVAGSTKAPDYCFRIGGNRKYFVEAKKPSVNLRDDIASSFQLRRYAWSAKLPLSILTDFEEFAVYDCRIRPIKTDKTSVGRVLYFTYKDYTDRWGEINDIFSREAILKGSFDKYAAGHKKGTAEVDTAFLKEIESWRELLARNLALRNPSLTARELNFAVQVNIDRIIFLRICEDRGIEPYGRLQGLCKSGEVYNLLLDVYRQADERYNSGLFHFQKEKGRLELPDELTPNVIIDDKLLKDILSSLYYPDSPYEFSVLPADILGQVYEQFLGKVIRLTDGHRAVIEEKPEVKKAGGVYYTPKYIVDYIVKNTVGILLEGNNPKQVSRLKILDPACGSGSFLIGAYQYLLDWHLDWYTHNNPEKWAKGKNNTIYQRTSGWHLTTAERRRILLNNIYGVDIDNQAVEVTKLSLLLKVLEGESSQTLFTQLKFFHERALPDLGNNIKCGNSLIGLDYWDEKLYVDTEEHYRINTFNWDVEFSEIMSCGGFDTIIGNPPYIQLSMADYYNREVNTYLVRNYSSSMGRLNTFGFFIEKALKSLLAKGGFLSFIVPNTILTQEYYRPLRQEMMRYRLNNITTYKYPVFTNAVVETVVFVVQKTHPILNKVEVVNCDNKIMSFQVSEIGQEVYLNNYSNAFLVIVDRETIELKTKLDSIGTLLKSIANINQAIAIKYDRSQSLFKEYKAENYKPVLDGRNIKRYSLCWDGNYLAYDINKIHSCKRTDIFEAKEKILFRRVGDRLIATYDDTQFYALNTLVVINLVPQASVKLKYLLGLLNSRLMNFYYVTYLKSNKKIFSEIQARQLSQLPIRIIDFLNQKDKAQHDRIVELVEQMLSLNKQLPKVNTAHERTIIQRQIENTDEQIDRLVYELYGLIDEEIRIVEGEINFIN